MPEQLSLFNEDTDTDIIDLDLSVTKKKKFRFNHNDEQILELNVSDMNIIGRITETYPKLEALQLRASTLMEGIETDAEDLDSLDEGFATIADRLKSIDAEMRDLIDYMFNANVSEVTAPDGSMYDPFNGSFRFEHIITLLMNQYESNLKNEYSAMEKQLSKHTAKYKK